jgi:hypothetical protein
VFGWFLVELNNVLHGWFVLPAQVLFPLIDFEVRGQGNESRRESSTSPKDHKEAEQWFLFEETWDDTVGLGDGKSSGGSPQMIRNIRPTKRGSMFVSSSAGPFRLRRSTTMSKAPAAETTKMTPRVSECAVYLSCLVSLPLEFFLKPFAQHSD